MNDKIMKKFYSLLVICAIMIFCISCTYNDTDSVKEDTSTDISEFQPVAGSEVVVGNDDNVWYVNATIESVTNTEDYQNGDVSQRYRMISYILNDLQSEGSIYNLYYDDGDCLFTFDYVNGTGGGVMLKDFDPDYN